MLSDEEKEAVDYWKKHMEILHCNTQLASEHYIKVLLDLVERQSKEIEEYKKQLDLDNECEIALNSKVMDLEKEIEELKNADLTTVYLNGVYDGEKKVKDKIKAKIEEVNYKMIAHQDVREAVKQVLQSLLEKE